MMFTCNGNTKIQKHVIKSKKGISTSRLYNSGPNIDMSIGSLCSSGFTIYLTIEII